MRAVLQRSRKNSLQQWWAGQSHHDGIRGWCLVPGLQAWSKDQLSSHLLSVFTSQAQGNHGHWDPFPRTWIWNHSWMKLWEGYYRRDKYWSKRAIPLFPEQECSSADAAFLPHFLWMAPPKCHMRNSSHFFLILPFFPAQSFNPSNHSPEVVHLISESFFFFLPLCLSIHPTSHPIVCLFLGWVQWWARSKVKLLNVHGLPFWNRTGPFVTESSQL